MKRAFVLCDDENLKKRIIRVMVKMNDKVEIVGSASNVHESIVEVIKHKPDFIIYALNENRDKSKFIEKYRIIKICDDAKKTNENICSIISEKEIDKIIKEIDEEKKDKTKIDESRLRKKTNMVVVGISTGGPYALKELIPKIKSTINVPMFIVQHMPPGFTREMARGLKRISDLDIVEAEDRMDVTSNRCYIMPGGKNMGIKNIGGKLVFEEFNQKYGFYTPSIDYLIESIIRLKDGNPLIAIMTGMGNDGFDGIRKIRHEKRGIIITQSKESCVVYGMPRVIDDAGMSDINGLSIEKIAEEINRRV